MHDVLLKAVVAANGTIISTSDFNFEPQGYTAMILLSESHIALHTWPEKNMIIIDIFTCGNKTDPLKGCHFLINEFKPKNYSLETIGRGSNYEKNMNDLISLDQKIEF
jgi:S-adenosylmethionine decarboxylase